MDLWNAILQNPEACILKVLFTLSKIIDTFELLNFYKLPRVRILSLHLLFNIFILIHYILELDNSTDHKIEFTCVSTAVQKIEGGGVNG